MEEARSLWYNLREPARIGLPAPIRRCSRASATETLFDAQLAGAVTSNDVTNGAVCAAEARGRRASSASPYPGELGRRIYENVSKEAWARWLQHQTMLINEYRLTPIEPKARKFLEAEMEKFFFGAGSSAPARLPAAAIARAAPARGGSGRACARPRPPRCG